MTREKTHALAWTIALAVLFTALPLPGVALADVYRWVDGDGVMHFTDTPKHKGYKVFIRDRSSRRRGRAQASARSSRFTDRDTYDNIIRDAAEAYNLDFSLIKAVISVESGFNPRAVSPKGARGLMQVMPSNFASLGIDDPYDPRENIMGGSKYLARMLATFNNDLDLALAAYNAGPGAVSSAGWRIPDIPETQSYVRRVRSVYVAYQDRQGGQTATFRADGSPVAAPETTLADSGQ